MKMFLVLAPAAAEGCVFDNIEDAEHAAGLLRTNPCSSLADAFVEMYGDDGPTITEVEVSDAAFQPSLSEPEIPADRG